LHDGMIKEKRRSVGESFSREGELGRTKDYI
jgi:hypothetical protein